MGRSSHTDLFRLLPSQECIQLSEPHGQAEKIGRLGIPALAVLWRQGPPAAKVRLCDREGCNEAGDRPAPKAPQQPGALVLLRGHAAEYNKNWNYFAGLSPEEAARRAAEEEQGNAGFRQSAQWKWAGPGDGSRSRDEMRALDALELDSDADFKAVKAAHRRLVKETHPDANPGDEEAAKRFKQIQAAYDVLKKSEERKNGAPEDLGRLGGRRRGARPGAGRSCGAPAWRSLGCFTWRRSALRRSISAPVSAAPV